MLIFGEHCSRVFRGSRAIMWYWRNVQNVLGRALRWATKPLRQSEDNGGRYKQEPQSDLLAFLVSVCGSPSNCIHTDYEATLTLWIMALGLEYLSEMFCGYCLDVYLSACKRISLDGYYFLWIFTVKNWQILNKDQLWDSSEQGKKLLNYGVYAISFLI